MTKGLYIAHSGMINEQHRLDVAANNVANYATNGYKKEGTTSQTFKDVFDFKIKDMTYTNGHLPQYIGDMQPGVKIGENYVDYSEGPIKETGNPYDLALTDKGFFAIEFANKGGGNEVKYTRDGNFTLTQNGELTTQEGDFVLDVNGNHIKLNTLTDSEIDRDGTIYQNGQTVAKIGIYDFQNYDKIERYGENYFQPIEQPIDGSEKEEAFVANNQPGGTQIFSGYLETSNVSVVDEMVSLIAIQRQYESNQKMIQTVDSTLDPVVNNLGRVGS
ncbi:MAG: flagellar basal-body rod protein FlgF [Lachnospiraceae bacterium]|nr:flagellar basal-body rod protein FlgF [Lachnospiraceae bacterium]